MVKIIWKSIRAPIQEMIDGSAIKLTTAKYYTPNDRHIHGNGIMPDVTVDYDELKNLLTTFLSSIIQIIK